MYGIYTSSPSGHVYAIHHSQPCYIYYIHTHTHTHTHTHIHIHTYTHTHTHTGTHIHTHTQTHYTIIIVNLAIINSPVYSWAMCRVQLQEELPMHWCVRLNAPQLHACKMAGHFKHPQLDSSSQACMSRGKAKNAYLAKGYEVELLNAVLKTR